MGLRMDRLNEIIQLLSSYEDVYVVVRKREKSKAILKKGKLKSITKNCNGEIEIFLENEFKCYIPINEIISISPVNQMIMIKSEKIGAIFEVLKSSYLLGGESK